MAGVGIRNDLLLTPCGLICGGLVLPVNHGFEQTTLNTQAPETPPDGVVVGGNVSLFRVALQPVGYAGYGGFGGFPVGTG
jgi:hypothetical protein